MIPFSLSEAQERAAKSLEVRHYDADAEKDGEAILELQELLQYFSTAHHGALIERDHWKAMFHAVCPPGKRGDDEGLDGQVLKELQYGS